MFPCEWVMMPQYHQVSAATWQPLIAHYYLSIVSAKATMAGLHGTSNPAYDQVEDRHDIAQQQISGVSALVLTTPLPTGTFTRLTCLQLFGSNSNPYTRLLHWSIQEDLRDGMHSRHYTDYTMAPQPPSTGNQERHNESDTYIPWTEFVHKGIAQIVRLLSFFYLCNHDPASREYRQFIELVLFAIVRIIQDLSGVIYREDKSQPRDLYSVVTIHQSQANTSACAAAIMDTVDLTHYDLANNVELRANETDPFLQWCGLYYTPTLYPNIPFSVFATEVYLKCRPPWGLPDDEKAPKFVYPPGFIRVRTDVTDT